MDLTESLAKCMSELRDRRPVALPNSASITMAVNSSILSPSWYESDSVLAVACGVIIIGAVYFLTRKKDDEDDDEDDGQGGHFILADV